MKTLVAIAAVVVFLGVVLAGPSLARADAPGATAPGDTPPRAATPKKKVSSAFLLTLAATSGPLAISAIGGETCGREACAASFGMIGLAGMILGPSAGHWYAGDGVTTGLVLRAGAATAVTFLALRDPYLESPVLTIGGLIAAVGVWETGVIWDLVTLPRAVRRHNRAIDLVVMPVVTDRSTGLALSGSW